jgi:hypothetical protein
VRQAAELILDQVRLSRREHRHRRKCGSGRDDRRSAVGSFAEGLPGDDPRRGTPDRYSW